jgi:hypothetical protein
LNRKAPIGLPGVLLLALGLCFSCRTAAPLPPADFSAPGWTVRQGQAVWKPSKHRPELAGDLLLATNADGSFFVQLTKNPFTIVTAESLAGRWQIEFGANEHSWRGENQPPNRFAWFQLPRALMNGKIAPPWQFETVNPDSWRLENPNTGETLEGGFFP